ncbi:type II toxin-antitoxin system RelE/ParE family toxin [Asticcacaulis sp. BYS171W]|uniref:Type II toxin-antitoxin system RelE/ParE family toxin n=1 Tax=Asticcacaulis aquaticus TaxID=2984212 RepID=A0ABT5HYJ7_9CAUL|nr:type II toxin-antitoxin system RelE/ParE family toxin [Asticcacaulis aquaticus]MDC7685152.1 type II toxin-antitoxin system RelE/ParE family toxin [Asticcacaulis aquaticus]
MSFILGTSAAEDLRSIVSYSRDRWGDDQARRYAAKLKQAIERLADGRGRFRDVSDMIDGLRVMRCEHHFIFGLVRENQPMLIVAILHERMDMLVKIGSRLE